jgi:NADH-quinone oxidoreductase subunit G
VQRFYPAVSPFKGPRADYRIIADVAQRLGLDVEGRAASLVFQRLAANVPDYAELSYTKLAQVTEQWPPVARHDLFYGGTGYENRQGMGVQLTPEAAAGRWSPEAEKRGEFPAVETRPAPQGGEVWVLPITRLYDRGTTLVATTLLRARFARPELWLNPTTAEALQLANNDQVAFSLAEGEFAAQIKIDETLPEGIALVPRSVGIPVSAPQAVKIQRLAEPVARL